MPSAVLLKKLIIHNLEGECFYREFEADCQKAEFIIVDVNSEKEEAMWSSFISILSSMTYEDIPVVTLDRNWGILMVLNLYEVNNTGTSLESVLELTVKCREGKIEYYAAESHGDIFSHYYHHEDVDNENEFLPQNCIGFCKAIQIVLQDINIYRWHPHRTGLETLSEYDDYFLNLHSRLYRENKVAYSEELNAVFSLHKPTLFDEFSIIDTAYKSNNGSMAIKEKFLYKSHNDTNFTEIGNTHDKELINLFYSYGEFMKYRDTTIGVFGILITDSQADYITNIFQRMLESTSETPLSQFFMFKTQNDGIT